MNNQIYDKINGIIEEGINEIRKIYSKELRIDFVDIFPKSTEEYEKLYSILKKEGKIIQETKTGNIIQLKKSYKTNFGLLKLVRIRTYDSSKKNYLGAPDFKTDYEKFKKSCSKHCKLIKRETYEMLELKGKKVLIYFPNETLTESLKKNIA